MSISPLQHREMLARLERNQVRTAPAEAVEDESELHSEIRAYCRAKGWICIESRMDKPTGQVEGVPDFIILAQFGSNEVPVIWLIEAKSKHNKLSKAQQLFHAHAKHLGHTVHVVYSMQEFMEVVG